MKLIKYSISYDSRIADFEEALRDAGLIYRCRDLFSFGIEDESEINLSILKSNQVLKRAGLNPEHHFKHVFITDIESGEIFSDWRISKTGVLLVLMHASGMNPMLNRIKMEMIRFFGF